jgi:hypothetical protein
MAGTILDGELNTPTEITAPARSPGQGTRPTVAGGRPRALTRRPPDAQGIMSSSIAPAGPHRTGIRFAPATEGDDAAIRRLLRANPTRGKVSLTFEREPAYFQSSGIADAEDQTIVAFDGEKLVCMGRATVRRLYLNGHPQRVGYLSELRLDHSAQGRSGILRRGYQFFRTLRHSTPPAFWYTSIAADNHRSIRFLEANLRGMPRYQFLSEFITLLIGVPRRAHAAQRLAATAAHQLEAKGLRCEVGGEQRLPELVRVLNQRGEGFQFAAEWTADRIRGLERHGLPLSEWLLVRHGRQAVAASALWDQRSFRQTVIRGYDRALAVARPAIRLLSAMTGFAGLPAVGSSLAHAFLSPLAVETQCRESLACLVAIHLARAQERGLEFLTLGLTADDETTRRLRRHFRCREYRSRLYRVSWPGDGDDLQLDRRPVLPEVALL